MAKPKTPTGPRKPYVCLRSVTHGTTADDVDTYALGETIQLTDAEAAELIKIGAVRAPETAKADEKPAS
jgi:hypothetical protein